MHVEVPKAIATLLAKYPGTWAVAGGWAIDLFLNQVTRSHQDIEIAIPRMEQLRLKAYFPSWQWQYVVDGTFYHWAPQQYLELPIHELHARAPLGQGLEVLLNEFSAEEWRFRRHLAITYPLAKAIQASPLGIPILAPEIVLLYKAKWMEEKDLHDLSSILPHLPRTAKSWLREAIESHHGGEHPWVGLIRT
ncbi:MAG: hypothetical protein AAF798_17165 [Bacteroidota bacterium]